jgi:integrase
MRVIFVIACHTGMRVGEIAQLYKDDVIQDSGVWCFRVDDKHPDQNLKYPASCRRLVPIHDSIREPLLRYAKSVKHKRLFPAVSPDGKGEWSGLISPRYSVLFRDTLKLPSGVVFHSTRHTVKTLLREHVSDSVSDRLLGQTTPGVGAKYGKVPLSALIKAVGHIEYPGVQWPKWK